MPIDEQLDYTHNTQEQFEKLVEATSLNAVVNDGTGLFSDKQLTDSRTPENDEYCEYEYYNSK